MVEGKKTWPICLQDYLWDLSAEAWKLSLCGPAYELLSASGTSRGIPFILQASLSEIECVSIPRGIFLASWAGHPGKKNSFCCLLTWIIPIHTRMRNSVGLGHSGGWGAVRIVGLSGLLTRVRNTPTSCKQHHSSTVASACYIIRVPLLRYWGKTGFRANSS